MSVYVDDAMIPWRGTRWCHLTADTVDELHEFAQGIGMKREWFQPHKRPEFCHYDVAPTYRAAAVAAGAIEETRRGAVVRALASVRAR